MHNLVVVMAGDQSLHESYALDRDYDLWVCHFGSDDAVADRYARTCDRLVRRKGLKWELARDLVRFKNGARNKDFSEYDYVFLPDDDVGFPGGSSDLRRAFALACDIRADIFQPAISNAFIGWEATRQVPGLVCRAATMVEIMMPAYSGEVFQTVIVPLLNALPHVRAGWNLEPVIAAFAEATLRRPMRAFLLDEVGAEHTRPVSIGSPLHQVGQDEAFLLSMFTSPRIREIARFNDRHHAARFEFPFLDRGDGERMLDRRMEWVRSARIMCDVARRSSWRRRILRYLIPEANL